ncbi:hypothetical protein XELAEV_18003388mg [Xenopus laevis]|nr:hypothetical protein XELAEV_18003388mg [Xenopus laevis]
MGGVIVPIGGYAVPLASVFVKHFMCLCSYVASCCPLLRFTAAADFCRTRVSKDMAPQYAKLTGTFIRDFVTSGLGVKFPLRPLQLIN